MEENEIEKSVLHAFEVTLEAQLKAIKRLRAGEVEEKPVKKRVSQISMVYDVLERAGQPLHINEIINRVEMVYGQRIDRESIVSALIKKVKRGDRFVRTGKNIFGLKEGK